MALAVAGKRQKPFGRSSPVKSRSGIFPRRPSGSKPAAKATDVPLFVPDEEDGAITQVARESGDEWEDFDEDLEEAQISIAIVESLESQHQPRRSSNTRAPTETPIPQTPLEPSRQTNMGDNRKAMAGDEDEFTSPSRLATQLAIAGARKPSSTRISSGSARGAAVLSTSTISGSPKKPTQSQVPNLVLGSLSNGDTCDKVESDEDNDMEEVTIPSAMGDHPVMPPESLVYPVPASATKSVETPLAIGVEDVVAKRFAEFQKIFAEKRSAFRAENFEAPEDVPQTREIAGAYSPGLEYSDNEIRIIGVEVKEKAAMEVRPSLPPHSDEDEDMEEVEIEVAPSPVPPGVPQPSANSEPLDLSTPAVPESPLPKRVEENTSREDEDVPISDWSRSPSPLPGLRMGEAGPSASVLTLDRSRGLLDLDESFEQAPPGEPNQEHEDFDAAHEMDPDGEAGEFARWMSQVKGRNLDEVRKEIEQEINGLRKEQKAAMRDSEDITGQMITQIMVSSAMINTAFAYHSEIRFDLYL